MQRTQDQDQPRKGRVCANLFKPVIKEVEEEHLRLCRSQHKVAKLFHLEGGLEGQLQLAALDYDIRKVQQVHLKGIQHAPPRHNNLLGLLFNGQGAR